MAKTSIDSDWFKEVHRNSGITQAEAAAVLGRSPTFLTRIYTGDQELKIGDARKLSNLFQVPLSQVLVKAGLGLEAADKTHVPNATGLAEPAQSYDVRQVNSPGPDIENSDTAQTWRVGTSALTGFGVMPGDNLRVDPNIRPQTGDVVIAQIYDWRSGTAETVVRGYSHPYLVKNTSSVAQMKPETVDNERIVIKGVVTMLWRERPTT